MPTYLCHGFRWLRRSVEIFVGMHDAGDVAPGWIIGRRSASTLLAQLHAEFDFLPERPASPPALYPVQTRATRWSGREVAHVADDLTMPPPVAPAASDPVLCFEDEVVRLLEEWDPAEETAAVRPYAYVADYAVRVDLAADLAAEMERYEEGVKGVKGENGGEERRWLGKLRDGLERDAKIGWYVVVCGDDREDVGDEDDDEEDEEEDEDDEAEEEKKGEGEGEGNKGKGQLK